MTNHFRCIPHQNDLARLHHYFEQHGTKKQELDKIDDYVFDVFEQSREKILSIHDIDLQRWTPKKDYGRISTQLNRSEQHCLTQDNEGERFVATAANIEGKGRFSKTR